MKKIIFLSAILLPLFFVSCEKDSDSEEIAERDTFVLVINNFGSSKINREVTDGTIYEMYLVAKDYNYVKVPEIKMENAEIMKLDMNKYRGNKFIVFFKVSPFPYAVASQNLRCIVGDDMKAKEFVLTESQTTEVIMDEEVQSANLHCTNIEDILSYMKEYLGDE